VPSAPDVPAQAESFPTGARVAATDHARCDVLVLGAGLAGMRAAWAAKQSRPHLRVVLVSPRRAPSGSSFANGNNALGMQAPNPREVSHFVAEVLRLAPPGDVWPELARALAADAPARLDDLLSLGLAFRRQPGGTLTRYPACFSPVPRAVIFDALADAHAAFLARVRGLGVSVLHGYEALALPRGQDGRVAGALLVPAGNRPGAAPFFLRARVTIAALGGPAPLFEHRLCGPGGSGLAYGLLRQSGATLVNARHVQFFWLRPRDGGFVNPGALDWPAPLADLAAARRSHCPMANGAQAAALPDAALDHALLARRDARGLVRLPGQEAMALFAHAGNGGASIDTQGRTDVPGLYACGECAGGMHGANRIGGGMVLSALVFGARAGAAAAAEACGTSGESCAVQRTNGNDGTGGTGGTGETPGATLPVERNFLRRLRRGMDKHAVPGAAPAPDFLRWLADMAQKAAPARQRLLALSALCVLGEA